MNLNIFIILVLITYNIGSINCKRSDHIYSYRRSKSSSSTSEGSNRKNYAQVFSPNIPAYWIMADLAKQKLNDSYSKSNYIRGGEVCINYEDFNGTKFGWFECPLPGFDLSARYCCGSSKDERQYCCDGFRESVIEWAILFGIISFGGIIFSLGILASRYEKSIKKYFEDRKKKKSMKILNEILTE